MTLLLLTASLIISMSSSASDPSKCLPANIKPSDVVSAQELTSRTHRTEVKTVTVAQRLKEIRARCRKGKVIDARGREIRFFRMVGCWGNPPENYEEILQHQAEELAKLRKRYHVIELTCNPSGQQVARTFKYRGPRIVL